MNLKPIFEGDFVDADDVFDWFKVPNSERIGVNIFYADYDYGHYQGTARVLFEKDGTLYEAYGSHCSCHGLEDQWEPDSFEISYLVYLLNGPSSWLSKNPRGAEIVALAQQAVS